MNTKNDRAPGVASEGDGVRHDIGSGRDDPKILTRLAGGFQPGGRCPHVLTAPPSAQLQAQGVLGRPRGLQMPVCPEKHMMTDLSTARWAEALAACWDALREWGCARQLIRGKTQLLWRPRGKIFPQRTDYLGTLRSIEHGYMRIS
jgi:hypothetical protein